MSKPPSVQRTTRQRLLLQRVVLALVPALVIASLAASAIWGESGLLVRPPRGPRLATANDELAAVDRENQRLLRELRLMEQDPVLLERVVAEELGWGREGAVLYRFDETP